jgi:hypothetical protein
MNGPRRSGFTAPLRGATHFLHPIPGLRFACPGLLSMPPYGRQCRLFILCRNAPVHFREAPIKCPISPKHPSGAKARLHFVQFTARLKRLRKNPERRANIPKNIPQGLKPILYYQHLAARLKSCPVTKLSPPGVFSRPKARRLLSCIYGTTEVVPCYKAQPARSFFAA